MTEHLTQEDTRTYRIGADIGGTFTDLVLVEQATGRITDLKIPTVVAAPNEGVDVGVAELLTNGALDPAGCNWFAHGQTIGLNAILTRRGASVGLITTQGFGDVLEIGRGRLPDPFDFNTQRTVPLIRRNFVKEVAERRSATGVRLQPLDADALRVAVDELVAMGVDSVIVSFLNSYADPAHEHEACALIASWHPSLVVLGAGELWPQAREYERTMVAVMNQYIGSSLQMYLGRLSTQLAARGISTPLLVCSSNGGVIPAEAAAKSPVLTLMSGPAAGVVAARYLQEQSALGGVVTFDMGGTSADMAVLSGEDLPYTAEREIDGLPIIMPSLDVTSIGAGGGSLARVDSLGVLKVGPESAGASPGPACYGLGGTQATVTDAYMVTGILDPSSFAKGRTLHAELAEEAVAAVAEQLELSTPDVAEGILRVATANLAREFTRLTARQGIDAREYTLLAFGGAGPTQGCLLADEMGVARVAFPRAPGTLCALGALSADFRMDYVKTLYRDLEDVRAEEISDWFGQVEQEGRQALEEGAEFIESIHVQRSADVRFHLQGYDINVTFDDPADIDANFRRRYYEVYGHLDETTPLDLVNLKATVVGEVSKPAFERIEEAESVQPEPVQIRQVYLSGSWREVPVYRRDDLRARHRFDGPALVIQDDTTCLVTDHWRASVDHIGTIILEREV